MVQCMDIGEHAQEVGTAAIVAGGGAIGVMVRIVGTGYGEELRRRSSSLSHFRFWGSSEGSGPEGCLPRHCLLEVERTDQLSWRSADAVTDTRTETRS